MTVADAKRAAANLWTQDPCESWAASGDPGTPEYLERLLAARRAYGPWISRELDYSGSSGLRVLDIGCGQGIDLVEYASAGADVFGVDITPRHVDLARMHLSMSGLSGTVSLGDAEALPFADASFDKVSSNGVLHHTPDIERALREIRRVLKPGGEAIVIVYNRGSLHYWIQQVLGHGVLRGGLLREGHMRGVLETHVEFSSIGARALVRVYSRGQLRILMREAGFQEIRIEARHFNPADTFITALLARVAPKALARPELRDAIGRLAGWYLVARGRASHP